MEEPKKPFADALNMLKPNEPGAFEKAMGVPYLGPSHGSDPAAKDNYLCIGGPRHGEPVQISGGWQMAFRLEEVKAPVVDGEDRYIDIGVRTEDAKGILLWEGALPAKAMGEAGG